MYGSDYDGCATIGAIILGVLLLFLIVSRVEITTDIKRFEQLRIDAKDVDPNQAEDVIGQITAANQEIIQWQYWNEWVFIELFIPDSIEAIKPIPVPKKEQL